MEPAAILEQRLTGEHYRKIRAVGSPALHEFLARFIRHLNPD